GDVGAAVRAGDGDEGRDAVAEAVAGDDGARVDAALTVTEEVDLARALADEELGELLGELARAHGGAVVGIEDGDLDRVAERLEIAGDVVKIGERADGLKAGPAVHEDHREAGGL